MLILYMIIMLFFFGYGIYHLFFEPIPLLAVYYLLIGLYFFVQFFELRGTPFSRWVYLLLLVLLIANGILNLMIPSRIFSGILCLLFALFTFRSFMQLRNSTR